jgi:hypothetical protein
MRSLLLAASPPRRAPSENVGADRVQIHVIAVLPHAGCDDPTLLPFHNANIGHDDEPRRRVEAVTTAAMQEPRQSRSFRAVLYVGKGAL